eukprot:805131-Amphidinium_carterae.2
MQGRTCPRTLHQYILFRVSVPACKTHVLEPHISDRVVPVDAGSMCAAEHMDAMTIKEVRTSDASLGNIFAGQIRRDERRPKAHTHSQTEDLRRDKVACGCCVPSEGKLVLKALSLADRTQARLREGPGSPD